MKRLLMLLMLAVGCGDGEEEECRLTATMLIDVDEDSTFVFYFRDGDPFCQCEVTHSPAVWTCSYADGTPMPLPNADLWACRYEGAKLVTVASRTY